MKVGIDDVEKYPEYYLYVGDEIENYYTIIDLPEEVYMEYVKIQKRKKELEKIISLAHNDYWKNVKF